MGKEVLQDRVALVTGGGRGIGRAIAISLAEAGAHVAVNYRARREQALETCGRIEGIGRRAAAVQADVSRAPDVQRLVAAVGESLGPVEIL